MVVLNLVSQPSIRTIEFHALDIEALGLEFGDNTDMYARVDPLVDPAYRASGGLELIFDEVSINFDFLEEVLFRTIGKVEAFTFIADTVQCVGELEDDQIHRPWRVCKGVKILNLGTALRHTRDSLKKLTILRNMGAHCRHDQTLLRSLATFTKLRHLRIDASYLLGNHPCTIHGPSVVVPPGFPAQPYRSAFLLSALLPPSIERLELSVCPLEQKCGFKRKWTYCNDILQGLLAEKEADGLQHLKHLKFTELPCCNVRYCFKSCEPGRVYCKSGPSVTKEEIHKWQKECGVRGIRLTYVQRSVDSEEWNDTLERMEEMGRPFWVRVYNDVGGVREFDRDGNEIVFGSLTYAADDFENLHGIGTPNLHEIGIPIRRADALS